MQIASSWLYFLYITKKMRGRGSSNAQIAEDAFCLSSGMAAISLSLIATGIIKGNRRVLGPYSCYGSIYTLLKSRFSSIIRKRSGGPISGATRSSSYRSMLTASQKSRISVYHWHVSRISSGQRLDGRDDCASAVLQRRIINSQIHGQSGDFLKKVLIFNGFFIGTLRKF
jgi:hypothetical protein